jgi:hypothetical protein
MSFAHRALFLPDFAEFRGLPAQSNPSYLTRVSVAYTGHYLLALRGRYPTFLNVT